MKYTKHYKIPKPELDDTIKITDIHSIADIVDSIGFEVDTTSKQIKSDEEKRIENEKQRVLDESKRVENEKVREIEENKRITNESYREYNEDYRKKNEEIRKSNEAKRTKQENNRISNEEQRIEKDKERVLKEVELNKKESIRESNEAKRIKQEENRIKVFKTMEEVFNQKAPGDMNKAIYDKDNDGIVDNAKTVDGHIVSCDVPKDAKFTDTIYDDSKLFKNINAVTQELNDVKEKSKEFITSVKWEDINDKPNLDDFGKVKSVNNKTGEVVLKAEDIKTKDGTNLEEFKKKTNSQYEDLANKTGKIGTKEVDETNIKDNSTLRYDKEKDKIVYVENKIDRIPPSTVTDLEAKSGDKKVTLTWKNPKDEDFAGVKILRKEGSYPTELNDGTVVYTGANTSYTDTTVKNNVEYFYRIFTYDTSNNFNKEIENQQITCTLKPYVIYGVKIDTNNSNPESAVTYTDMAQGFTPAKGNYGNFNYGSWKDKFPFNKIKPCLYKDGKVNYYLNPNDYTKKINSEEADVTSGKDGDVMVEFPKVYWKFERKGDYVYIKYSDYKIDDTYKCLAHMQGEQEKDKCYIGAYLGNVIDGKLRSLSGKSPTTSETIGTFRSYAQKNGKQYNQIAYCQLLMLQVLYIVMFKNRDSQTALGRGYVDDNSSKTETGATNKKGLFYGESTGKKQMKFCGIEDFYGNCYYWIDGLYCNNNREILVNVTNANFNDTGSGYKNCGKGASSNINGYIKDIQGTTETGFLIKESDGSSSTYYPDYGALYSGSLPYFGGYWSGGSNAGAFRLDVDCSASYSYSDFGGRAFAL